MGTRVCLASVKMAHPNRRRLGLRHCLASYPCPLSRRHHLLSVIAARGLRGSENDESNGATKLSSDRYLVLRPWRLARRLPTELWLVLAQHAGAECFARFAASSSTIYRSPSVSAAFSSASVMMAVAQIGEQIGT